MSVHPSAPTGPSAAADGIDTEAVTGDTGPAPRPPAGVASALVVLLAAATLVSLVGCYADYRVYASLTSFIDDGLSSRTLEDFAAADRLGGLAVSLQALALLPSVVLFLVWFHQVRVTAAVFAPEGFSRGTRWAVGCWFIPIGQLWLPFKTATEIWGASAQAAPDGSWRRVSYGPVVAWWATWIGSKLLAFTAHRLAASGSATALRTAATVSLTADLLFLASGALAIRFVRTLTAMQHTRATEGPNALV
ncbi:DUF4328 domain-containing protein [Streptomyces sp. NPDC002138]|uniref:DUF4328 domain-containing protein n=1 Tax=Streptomyces sp. NPDC002138 TaxID=3154410 RepID=UPI0033312340